MTKDQITALVNTEIPVNTPIVIYDECENCNDPTCTDVGAYVDDTTLVVLNYDRFINLPEAEQKALVLLGVLDILYPHTGFEGTYEELFATLALLHSIPTSIVAKYTLAERSN